MNDKQQCPHCGRWLLPVEKGRYKVLCWPRHMLAAYSQMSTAARNAAYQEHRFDNIGALPDNELPCPLSGTPIDL